MLASAAVPVGAESTEKPFVFSSDYRKIFSQVSTGGAVQALVVVLTVFLMATHAGA